MKTFLEFLAEHIDHKNLDVHPGEEFTYIRNTEKAPKASHEDHYAQKIEPHGRYMQAHTGRTDNLSSNMETGKHTFKNPLYIHWGSGSYKDPDNWKQVLHKKYNAKGLSLSRKIKAAGHDGIVTVGHHPSMGHYTSEIVDLTPVK